ncbi:MAG: carbon-nitrogen family hydrolase [Acidimicrobiia bacterium]
MKVAAIQHDVVWEDRDANFTRLAPMIADAAADGARVVLLTELYSTGFSLDTARTAEPEDGPSTQFLADQAVAQGVWVGGSLPALVPGADRPCNRFVLAGPGGERVHYDKLHPFSYGHEDEHYAAGSTLVTVDVEGVRCSLFVCYDLRFADQWWGLAPETDCYFVVASWPAGRRGHWRTLLRARAIENQAYVVGANRAGSGGGLDYAGDSAVIDPFGEELAVATDGGTVGTEQTITADVDPAHVAHVRARYPFLQDRR